MRNLKIETLETKNIEIIIDAIANNILTDRFGWMGQELEARTKAQARKYLQDGKRLEIHVMKTLRQYRFESVPREMLDLIVNEIKETIEGILAR